MSYVPLIRLFLSSPGDVYEERAIVHEEIETLINRPYFREKIAFRVIAWDKKGAGTVMRFRMPPQEAINLGLPRPSQCDVVVVLFWSRLGTPFALDGKDYQSGTHYELLDALDSSRPEVVIYKRKETPYFNPDAPDFKERAEQYERLKKFLETEVFIDPQTGSSRGISYYASSEDFRIEFRTALEQLALDFLDKLKDTPRDSALPNIPQVSKLEASVWDGSPFPGLRAFRREDAPIYFGRGREADLLIKRLASNRFVAVVGASGSGKSSLVAAGAIPRLQERNAVYNQETASEFWYIVQFTPSSHKGKIYQSPFEALYYSLLEVFPNLVDNPLRAQRVKREFLEDILKEPQTLCEACKFLLLDTPAGSEVVLYIDQFEELFTLVAEAERKPFVAVLKAASESSFMRVLLTMRSDFYQHSVNLPELAQLLQQGQVPLSTPTGGAIYEMVQFPADRAALSFEEGLVQTILKDTGESAGALALLAYALDELYQIAEKRGDRRITFDDYEALGGVHGAIGKRAEAVFLALEAEDKESTLKELFHALVSVSEDGTPTRQRIAYHAEKAAPAIRSLVEALTQARLLSQDKNSNDGSATLEVAHEALFRSWERLKNWIAEAQEDLILLRQAKSAAQEWQSKKRPDFLLWPQERLVLVYAMQERLKPVLNEIEEAFIEREQERLYRELEILETSHERRRDIGDRLAVIGDTRAGVGLKDGLPDIMWLPVNGSNGKCRFNTLVEDYFDEFEVPNFYVSKYLITYAQYQAFADSDYDNPQWWIGFPDEIQPQPLASARIKIANAPRDNISWYQAMAFCRWLDVELRRANLLPDSSLQVRLPSEWEWQWVAQQGEQRYEYAWGDWQDGYANTGEAGLNRTIAVGMYPHGKTEHGALDIVGNLYEWCLNARSNVIQMSQNRYVISTAAGVTYMEIGNGNVPVMLRGGSFYGDRFDARTSYCLHVSYPSVVNFVYGFRLVLAPYVSLDFSSKTE